MSKFASRRLFMILVLVLLLAVLIVSCMRKPLVSQYEIDNDDVLFYGRDTCPFCVKMKKQLKNDNILHYMRYIDVETEKGAEEFQTVPSDGVPHFSCNSTGKTSTGFKSTNELLKDLGLQ